MLTTGTLVNMVHILAVCLACLHFTINDYNINTCKTKNKEFQCHFSC